ncbi:MAG: hypothetical protein H7336_06715 [Bacteriovorax sp.]|nr:hypothetical protein [Bacteriovorax sp.]
MKSTILALAALACSASLMASTTASQSMDQFCADRSDLASVKELTLSSSNMMAFQNHGGIGGGGVCWWHSRMQRNALYLTKYNPADPKPSNEEAAVIVAKIRDGKEIVTIPGYRNFSEFTNNHQAQVQRELEKWQKGEGILKASWIIGLKGDSTVAASELKTMMDELYKYVVVDGNIAYEKLQIKGITAHAWLVVNMKPTSVGYDLQIIDSNFPNWTSSYRYTEGMTSFNHQYYGSFTPYLERTGEMEKIALTVLKKCNPDEYKARKKKARAADNNENKVTNNNNNG